MATAGESWVCTVCGNRQPSRERCGQCGDDTLLDLRKFDTIAYLNDVDARTRDRREGQIRALGVALGMAVVFGLWTQGWWWDFRSEFIALPLLIDQIGYMFVLALGAMAVLHRVWPAKQKFSWLDEHQRTMLDT